MTPETGPCGQDAGPLLGRGTCSVTHVGSLGGRICRALCSKQLRKGRAEVLRTCPPRAAERHPRLLDGRLPVLILSPCGRARLRSQDVCVLSSVHNALWVHTVDGPLLPRPGRALGGGARRAVPLPPACLVPRPAFPSLQLSTLSGRPAGHQGGAEVGPGPGVGGGRESPRTRGPLSAPPRGVSRLLGCVTENPHVPHVFLLLQHVLALAVSQEFPGFCAQSLLLFSFILDKNILNELFEGRQGGAFSSWTV